MPVFVLANVVVDIEVLLAEGWPIHRYWHTLLVGTAVGAIWAVAAYPLRHFFKRLMQLFRIPYQTSFAKMLISGILGVWLHVLLDGIYHWDVRVFWPSKANPLWKLVSQGQVEAICIAFFIAAIIAYVIAVVSYTKQDKIENNS